MASCSDITDSSLVDFLLDIEEAMGTDIGNSNKISLTKPMSHSPIFPLKKKMFLARYNREDKSYGNRCK